MTDLNHAFRGNTERDDLAKVMVPLQVRDLDDSWPPYSAENVWAIKLQNGTLKINNVPFYAIGLHYGDIVAGDLMADGRYRFTGVVTPSKWRTWRMMMVQGAEAVEERDSLIRLFIDLDCIVERDDSTGVTAVGASGDSDVSTIEAILRGCAERRLLEFDRG